MHYWVSLFAVDISLVSLRSVDRLYPDVLAWHRDRKHCNHKCIIRTGYWTLRWSLFSPMRIACLVHTAKTCLGSGVTSRVSGPLYLPTLPASLPLAYRLFLARGMLYKYKTSLEQKFIRGRVIINLVCR